MQENINLALLWFSVCILFLFNTQVSQTEQTLEKNFILIDEPLFSVSIAELQPVYYLGKETYVKAQTELSAHAVIEEPPDFKNLTHHFRWASNNQVVSNDVPDLKDFKYENASLNEKLELTLAVSVPFNKSDGTIETKEYTASTTIPLIVQKGVAINESKKNMFNILKEDTLNVSFTYEGSPDFIACYYFVFVNAKKRRTPYVCKATKENSIDINRWFKQEGVYDLNLTVKNYVSSDTRSYRIEVKDSVHKKTLPFVPITCSILAALILIIGIAVNLKLRRTVHVETANFDWLQEGGEADDDSDDADEDTIDFLQRITNTLFWFRRPAEDELNITTASVQS